MSDTKRTDPELHGRACMMALDLTHGVTYHTDAVRDILARAYLDLMDLLHAQRVAHDRLEDMPYPIKAEDWQNAHKGYQDWPKCPHGFALDQDGKTWCTRCAHPKECIHGVGLCTGSCK